MVQGPNYGRMAQSESGRASMGRFISDCELGVQTAAMGES